MLGSGQGALYCFPHTYVRGHCLVLKRPPWLSLSPPCGLRLVVWSPQISVTHTNPLALPFSCVLHLEGLSYHSAVPVLHRLLEMPSRLSLTPAVQAPTLFSPLMLCISTCLYLCHQLD